MKKILIAALRGAAAGMALNSAICLISANWRKLG